MLLVFLAILLVSFLFAWRSMKDFHMPLELKKLILNKKVKGTIVFLKSKVVHYK